MTIGGNRLLVRFRALEIKAFPFNTRRISVFNPLLRNVSKPCILTNCMTITLMDSNYRLDRLGVHIFLKCLLSDVCRFLQRHTSFLMLLPLLKSKKLHLSPFDISNIFQLRYCCTQIIQLREYL